MTWSVNGEQVGLDLLDITGVEWRDARRASGMRRPALVKAALVDKDLEAIAALLWIALRRQRPDLAYEGVLAGLTLRSLETADG